MRNYFQHRADRRRAAFVAAIAALAALAVTLPISSSASASLTGAPDALSASPFTSGPPIFLGMEPVQGTPRGGHNVRIHGKNFGGATEVHFGAASAAIVSVSNTVVVAVAPPGIGVVDVTVTTPLGTTATTPGDEYTYAGHPPGVSGLSPRSVPAAGDVPVTITGVNFYGVTAVHFGPADSPSFTVNSETSITALAPPAAVSTIEVMVTTEYGTSESEFCEKNRPCSVYDLFKYIEPTVTELSPSNGPKAGGASITITGTGFAPGSTETVFDFGSSPATSVNCSSFTTCTALTPAVRKAGSQPVVVTVDRRKNVKGTALRYTFE
jgi:hypothetical protein